MELYNKDDFVRRMARKGYTIKACGVMVDDMLETLTEILEEGDGVRFRGFGTFDIRQRKARESISPLTKETITVPACNAVHFTVGNILKSRVRDGKEVG